MAKTSTRPTSLRDMHERSRVLFTALMAAPRPTLQLRTTDVVITPFSKSGTTWTQQIVHTLRTRGDMDFDDISRVVPWIEVSPGLGIDLNAEQRANPRAFKSHLTWQEVPKGGRYINVVRDPADVLVSLYKFEEGWFFEPGSISLDEFALDQLKARSYFKHLLSWWPRRQQPDVLFLAYEHLLRDPRAAIERIAQFINVTLDAQLLATTLEYSSLPFMQRHADRFDDAMMRARSEQLCDLPSGSDSSKVGAGISGAGARLGAQVDTELAAAWAEEITANLGATSYAALIAELA